MIFIFNGDKSITFKRNSEITHLLIELLDQRVKEVFKHFLLLVVLFSLTVLVVIQPLLQKIYFLVKCSLQTSDVMLEVALCLVLALFFGLISIFVCLLMLMLLLLLMLVMLLLLILSVLLLRLLRACMFGVLFVFGLVNCNFHSLTAHIFLNEILPCLC